MTAETERFLTEVLPQQRAAEQALHNGDVEPRLALWSRTDPVTLFGAMMSGSGWSELEPTFRKVAAMFSESSEYEFEVTAAGASGDLAYTVGYEHNRVKLNGEPGTYTLRVTHIYRREGGQWRIVHRHGDIPPGEERPI